MSATPKIEDIHVWTFKVARAAAAVGNYCDHVEHNEVVDRAWILDSGAVLREIAYEIFAAMDLSPLDVYTQRLQEIESRNVLHPQSALPEIASVALSIALAASTWRDLQRAQSQHDRDYHPDVIGLSKYDQLRHYAFHLSKLAGALAEVCVGELSFEDFCAKRLADILLFGIKLSTVCNQALPDSDITDLV
jgi:hypothetical protein